MNPSLNYPRYANDLSLAYGSISASWLSGQDITLLYADGRALLRQGVNISNGAATIDAIAAFFAQESEETFVYVTNHGDRSAIQLWGDAIPNRDFAALANSHIAERKIFVFEQCYSGVLLPMLERKGVLAISACSDNEPSRCSPNQLSDDFSLQFFSLAQTLSFAEAFSRARTMLSGPQNPRMSDISDLAANFRIC
jgi:hypothetical protein